MEDNKRDKEVTIIETQTLTLNSKAFSINSMYCRDRNHTTIKYKNWARSIFQLLRSESNLASMKTLRDTYIATEHRYIVNFTFNFPEIKLFTKTEGHLSSRAFDVSNIEKPLIDLIFLPKYFNVEVQNLNTDDKNISDLSSKKRLSNNEQPSIHVEISIALLEDIKS